MILTATAAAFITASGKNDAKQAAKRSAESFFQRAAKGQQAEIVLGQLASERAQEWNGGIEAAGPQLSGASGQRS